MGRCLFYQRLVRISGLDLARTVARCRRRAGCFRGGARLVYHASLRRQNQVLSEGSLIKAGTKKTFKKSESEYLGAAYDARFQRFHSLRSDEPRPLAHCH